MEKSHHVAKSSSQAHSQHGGTKDRTSVVVQQYEFWYRNIQHRYDAKLRKRIADAELGLPDVEVVVAGERRRYAWHASNAAAACREWRAARTREGRRYVIASTEGEAVQAEDGIPPGSGNSNDMDEELTESSQCPEETQDSTQSDYGVTDIT